MTVGSLAALAASVAVGGASLAGYSLLRDDESSETTLPEQGVPTEVTADELRSLANRLPPTYWVASLPAKRLELTTTPRATYVRYLGTLPAGNSRTSLTVATYRVENAWSVATSGARRPDAGQARLPDGALVVWRRTRPNSVYLAWPESDRLVEVFDPQAGRARELSLSGLVQRVHGG